jgi:protein TonB
VLLPEEGLEAEVPEHELLPSALESALELAPPTASLPASLGPEVATLRTARPANAAAPSEAAPAAPSAGGPRGVLRPLSQPPRVYPPEALRRQIEGDVFLEIAIEPDGRVSSARVFRSSGHAVLDDTAVRHALATRWAPIPERRVERVRYPFRLR